MSKISVVYWSQSGNTAAMAEAVAKGITDAGKEAEIVFVSSASIDELKNETAFAVGCPAMGAEVLEESEMEPLLQNLKQVFQEKLSDCSDLTDGVMVNG